MCLLLFWGYLTMRQNCKVIVDHCVGRPSQSICFSYWKHSMLLILRLIIFKILMALKTLTILIIFDHTAVNIQQQKLRMRQIWLPSLLWKTKRTRKPGKRTKYKLQKTIELERTYSFFIGTRSVHCLVYPSHPFTQSLTNALETWMMLEGGYFEAKVWSWLCSCSLV